MEELYIHRINNPADSYSYRFQTCYNLNDFSTRVENIGGSLEQCYIIKDEYSPYIGNVITPVFAVNPQYLKVIINLNH